MEAKKDAYIRQRTDTPCGQWWHNEQNVWCLNAVVAEMDMGKPLFKAPDGGRIDILREWEDVTQSEVQQGFGT